MAKPKPKLKLARSAERDALAEAISRHGAAVARREKIEAARETVFTYAAREAVEQAERAVEDAKARAARALFEKTIGPTVAEAKAAHATAQEALEAAEAARDNLEREVAAAESEVSMSTLKLDRAVADVVKSDPAAAKLAARFREVQREHADLASAAQLLEGSALPIGVTALRSFPDLQARGRWEAALAALRTDADAELPAT